MIVKTSEVSSMPLSFNREILLLRDRGLISIYKLPNLEKVTDVDTGFERYIGVGILDHKFVFQVKQSRSEFSIHVLNCENNTIENLGLASIKALREVNVDQSIMYLSNSSEGVSQVSIKENSLNRSYICFENEGVVIPPAKDDSYFVGSNPVDMKFRIFDRQLNKERELDLGAEIGDVTSRIQAYQERFYSSNRNKQFFCINPRSESIDWIVDDWSSVSWCTQNGKALTVFKNKLKILDLETGELDFEQELDWPSEWGNEEHSLFQSAVSDTHFWCAFMGKGLCAINLETKEIDWHDYNGSTVNVPPVIIGNRVFIWLLNGGIGIGESDKEQFLMLEVQQ